MQYEPISLNVEKTVQDLLAEEGTGHDWWHIERVRNNAKHIHSQEGGNWFVIEMAVLLHDVGDRKVVQKAEDDYTIAENLLIDQDVSLDQVSQIMHIIKNMSFSKSLNNKKNAESIEFRIVQDADRLDAIGAIGIARAFAYGGSKARPIYDPTKTAQKIDTTEHYRQLNSSTFHHFEEKLLLVKDLLNTKTAQKIAEKRDVFMRKYLEEFIDEWYGKK